LLIRRKGRKPLRLTQKQPVRKSRRLKGIKMATVKTKKIKSKKPKIEMGVKRGGRGAPKQKQSTGGKVKQGKR